MPAPLRRQHTQIVNFVSVFRRSASNCRNFQYILYIFILVYSNASSLPCRVLPNPLLPTACLPSFCTLPFATFWGNSCAKLIYSVRTCSTKSVKKKRKQARKHFGGARRPIISAANCGTKALRMRCLHNYGACGMWGRQMLC